MRKLLIAMAVLVTSLAATLTIASGTAFAGADCPSVTSGYPYWVNTGWTWAYDTSSSGCTGVDKVQVIWEDLTGYYTGYPSNSRQYSWNYISPVFDNTPWAIVGRPHPCHDVVSINTAGAYVGSTTIYEIHNRATNTWGPQHYTTNNPLSAVVPNCVG